MYVEYKTAEKQKRENGQVSAITRTESSEKADAPVVQEPVEESTLSPVAGDASTTPNVRMLDETGGGEDRLVVEINDTSMVVLEPPEDAEETHSEPVNVEEDGKGHDVVDDVSETKLEKVDIVIRDHPEASGSTDGPNVKDSSKSPPPQDTSGHDNADPHSVSKQEEKKENTTPATAEEMSPKEDISQEKDTLDEVEQPEDQDKNTETDHLQSEERLQEEKRENDGEEEMTLQLHQETEQVVTIEIVESQGTDAYVSEEAFDDVKDDDDSKSNDDKKSGDGKDDDDRKSGDVKDDDDARSGDVKDDEPKNEVESTRIDSEMSKDEVVGGGEEIASSVKDETPEEEPDVAEAKGEEAASATKTEVEKVDADDVDGNEVDQNELQETAPEQAEKTSEESRVESEKQEADEQSQEQLQTAPEHPSTEDRVTSPTDANVEVKVRSRIRFLIYFPVKY